MVRIDLEAFKAMYYDNNLSNLYHRCLPVATYDLAGQPNRAVTIDETAIKGDAFKLQFRAWVAANPDKILPAVDLETETLLNPPDPPSLPAQSAKPAATSQNREDLKETETRYKYWVQERGLLNSVANGNLIDAWMSTHESSYTAAGLDRAIEANRASLAWYTPPTTEYIPGSTEVRLPLGTRPSPKYTVRQLQDLDRREREAVSATRRAKNTELAKSLK